MYSLYRAWFGDSGPSESYPRLQETLSPPDTVVRVGIEGEHQFVAHKGVLAAHSGYLKALLANASNTSSSNFGSCSSTNLSGGSSSNASIQASREPVTSVSVSSIGGEAFAPLLNYMYTGRLEVTLDNVYSVLLATHLLHMPGALEQCRAALLRLRAAPPLPTPMPMPGPTPATSTSSSSNILRPIPNRIVVGPPLCWPQPAPLYATGPPTPGVGLPHLPQLQPTTAVLMQSTMPPNINVLPATSVSEPQDSTRYSNCRAEMSRSPKLSPTNCRARANRSGSRSTSPEIVPSVALPFVAAATAAAFTAFATSSTARASPSPSSMSPSSSSPSQSPSRRVKRMARIEQRRSHEKQSVEKQSQIAVPEDMSHRASKNPTESTSESSTATQDVRERSSRRRGRTNSRDSSSSGVLSVVYDVACCDGPVRFHRVLNANYSAASTCGSTTTTTTTTTSQNRVQRTCTDVEESTRENDENGGPATVCGSPAESGNESSATGGYTCGYCRHTFKSQYCYRKHTKRHLLPTRMSEVGRQRQESGRNRREVRLLDLNVQYYPCKICGCKFPSYYFVHKHRKLCHANVAEDRSSRSGNEEESARNQEEQSASSSVREAP